MANVLLGIHCVVAGCGSTLRRVNQWKAKPCSKPKHKGKLHSQCMCPEPYQFFKFPAEVKLQKLWLERVKRPDLEVNNLTRVCSLHFVEGRPTRRHYFPNVNIHQEEDEADNEEETEEQQYYDEQEEDLASASPPPKKGRSGPVSIVPMELLQEQGGDATHGEQAEDEEYEGDLTISRFNYQGNEDGVYEMPTNSVTITRVTSIPAAPKPSNRFINTKKNARVETPVGGNRFLKERATTSTGNILRSNRPKPTAALPQARPSTAVTNLKSNTSPLRTGTGAGRSKVQQQPVKDDDNCPYEIDMVVDEGDDDDDGDSSELSDIGIDIQPTALMKQKYTSKDISTAKTLSSLVHRQHVTLPSSAPPQKDPMQIVKPKIIPVLAVAPKSQLQFQQQGAILQPIQAIARTTTLLTHQIKKPISSTNLFVAAAPSKSIVTTSSSGVGGSAKTVIAVAGSSATIKAEPATTAAPATSSSSTMSSSSSTGTEQKTSTAPSLATYDPSKQQLQIANPVKYIQECHTRIAQLLAEKQSLESRNTDLEAKVQELQKSNNDLRREIVHQALNAARRTPPQLNTPTFNLVPTAIMETTSSSTESQNGNGSSDGTSGNKPRIRYVIRRPPNLTSGTNSTK